MILVNFGDSQHTQQILSTAEFWKLSKIVFLQLLLYNISYIMHSFSAMTKVQKEKKNTSPRTAPAMSCSRLKILFHALRPLCPEWNLLYEGMYIL